MDQIQEKPLELETKGPAEQKTHDISELNKEYDKANDADSELFSEMRSNLLLESGNHYSKKLSMNFFNNIRNAQKLSDNQKLRLTKNHTQKITKTYKNAILEQVPGVVINPHNELEVQDRKASEMNGAVWKDMQDRYGLHEHRREGVSNFVTLGERCSFIYYDPEQGPIRGYNQMQGPDGMPLFDEMGNPVPDMQSPVFEGVLCFKQIPAYNLLRHPGAKSMKKSHYLILREMVARKDLEITYGDDPQKLSFIKGSSDEEFIVFDSNKKAYEPTKEDILVRYHFYRPCKQYPNGYYYIAVKAGILEQGELPFGIFPIIWGGFDQFSDNPRASSIIKVARPYQAEINRAASQMAMAQITLGDDKIVYQAGSKLAPGALLPGVRGISVTGNAPQIIPGRDGGQFIQYIESNIREMYIACMLDEIVADDPSTSQLDPYALLFRSASQKKAFKTYVQKTEEFEKELCLTALEFAKKYYNDDMLIKVVGKSETVNIAEFRQTVPNSFIIKAEPQSDAADTQLGKQMTLDRILQYAGNQLTQKQIGLVMKEMPFLNNKTLFKYLTSDYDNVENDMLAIERGQMPDISPYADNELYVNALTHRMKQPDFKILHPAIQNIYNQVLVRNEQEIKRKADALQAAKDGFIPTDGALITCSMQVPDPDSKDGGTKQVRLPYTALMWLIEKLEAQGKPLNTLENMNDGVVAEMMGRMGMNPSPQAPQPPQLNMNAPQMG